MTAVAAERAGRRGRSAQPSTANKPERKSFRAVAGTEPVLGRKYASPSQLEQLSPYSRHSWRLWVYQGRIPGCLKPNGKRGRLLIPLDEAEKLLKAGAQS